MGAGVGLLGLAVLAALPAGAAGQEAARALEATRDGTVRFSYPTRPGVEICDRELRMGDRHQVYMRRDGRRYEATGCTDGPAVVEVRVRDGRVRSLEVLEHRAVRDADAREVGLVTAREAVDLLAGLAAGSSATSGGAEDAVFPMVLADVERVWEELLTLARDRSVPGDARESALFWLGQEAAEAATRGLVEVASDEGEEQDVREAAVFALSQRPEEEALPVLMELARTAREPGTRRSALFWLAQLDAPEVADFFAEILRGGEGG